MLASEQPTIATDAMDDTALCVRLNYYIREFPTAFGDRLDYAVEMARTNRRWTKRQRASVVRTLRFVWLKVRPS